MDEKILKFRSSIKEQLPVIFCVQCGSTHVDQNSVDELKCYDCGNQMKWNGHKFSISRNKTEQDAVAAFRNALKK